MKDVIKKTGISKNTLIRWEMSGKIKVRRDKLFKFRIWSIEDVNDLKKLAKYERGWS